MNRFTTSLDLRSDMPPASRYTLLADLVYQSDTFGTITAPAGTVTDFASIPRAAFSFLDPEDPCVRLPSVVHDAIYSAQGKVGDRVALSREQADSVLREAMLASGASAIQAGIVFRAVRLFGGSHWKP